MSGPSEKAIEAGRIQIHENYAPELRPAMVVSRAALDAAHDPALGLDRSVCLRDVVEACRDAPSTWVHHGGQGMALYLEEVFGP